MKFDEEMFFSYCYILQTHYSYTIRDIIEHFFNGIIHPKRCRYLLKMWSRLGFYNYGCSLDLGWFESINTMPEQYRNIVMRIFDH